MKNFKKPLVITVLIIFLTVAAYGCGAVGNAAGEPEAQPTMITAYNEDVPVSEAPTEEPEIPEESPEPEASAPVSDIPQLNIEGNFMSPHSLDGIDPLNDKVVALTFDDGPHPEHTDRLLQILKDNGAVATFFVLGDNVEKYPEVAKRIYDSGNEIGTHSYDHTDLMKLSADQVISEQYGKTNDILEEAVGARALFDRPPYGSMSDDRAVELGREQIMWSVDPEDWKDEYKTTDKLIDNIFNGTNSNGIKAADGSIILSHDIHKTTVDAYDAIIKEFINQGYKFVTVSQMMQIAEIRGKEIGYKFNGAPTAESAANSSASPTGEQSPQPSDSGASAEA